MAPTILLAKVCGLFLVIVGTAIALSRHEFVNVVADFARERLLRTVVSAIELLAGLFMVMLHNDWSSVPAGIISLFGWMLVVEGVVYLTLPNETVERLTAPFNSPPLYLFGGIAAVAMGVYLAVYGFGA